MWKFPRKFSLMITLSQIPVSLLIAVEKYGLLATLLICTARDNVTVGSWNSTSSLGSCTQHYRMSQIQLKLWIVSIVVFASFQVCNYERFIREGKIKEDKLPSSLMYLQKLLRSTQPGSEYRRAISSSNRARTQSQAGARGPGAVRWPSHFFFGLYMGQCPQQVSPRTRDPEGAIGFPSTAQPGARLSNGVGRTSTTGRAPVAPVPSANTKRHQCGQKPVTQRTFLKHWITEQLPVFIRICSETNIAHCLYLQDFWMLRSRTLQPPS